MSKDGGPAFPVRRRVLERYPDGTPSVVECPETNGMTLRDYFAAKAMQSLLPAFAKGELSPKEEGRKVTEELIAEQAYYFADAMIKAREQ